MSFLISSSIFGFEYVVIPVLLWGMSLCSMTLSRWYIRVNEVFKSSITTRLGHATGDCFSLIRAMKIKSWACGVFPFGTFLLLEWVCGLWRNCLFGRSALPWSFKWDIAYRLSMLLYHFLIIVLVDICGHSSWIRVPMWNLNNILALSLIFFKEAFGIT